MRKHRLIGLVLIVSLLVCGMANAAPIDHVYIANELVDKFNLDGSLDRTLLPPGTETLCRAISVDGSTGNIWLGCEDSGDVALFGPGGAPLLDYCFDCGGQANHSCIDPYGNLWLLDRVNDRVFKFQPDFTRLGPYSVGSNQPSRIACDSLGNVWTTNTFSNVSKLANNGSLIGTYPYGGDFGIAIDPDNNIWVTEDGIGIRKLGNDGSNLGFYPINEPDDLAFDNAGNLWVTRGSDGLITKLSPAGTNLGNFPVPFIGTSDIVIDASGNLWIVDPYSSEVIKLSNDGVNLGTFPLSGNSGEADTGFLHQHIVLGYNSVEGPNVWVPLNGGAPAGAVTLNYDTITAMGDTDYVESGAGLAPPAGYTLGNPPEYYDITTTATFSGNVEVCIGYDEAEYDDEATLKLFHNEAGWVDVTTSLDITNNILCGVVSSLSGEFAGMELAGPYCGPGLFCYGDQDGDGIATLVDYNAARDEALIMPVDYSQVYPSNSETLDVDASFSVDLVDVNIMRDWALLKTNALADPGIPATVTILSPPDLSVVAIGETVELVVEVRGSGSALRPGVGLVFELLSGSATFLGGRGNAALQIDPDTGLNYTAGSRWSVTGDIAGGAVAKMVLKRDTAGMILLQARVPQSPLKQLPASVTSAILTLN